MNITVTGDKIVVNRMFRKRKELTFDDIKYVKILTSGTSTLIKRKACCFYSKDEKKLFVAQDHYSCFDILESAIKKHRIKIRRY